MLLGDQRKKNLTKKIILIFPLAFLPMILMFVSFLIFNDRTILITIVIVYFLLATSIALFIINMMKKEQTTLKGRKVKVYTLEYKIDLDHHSKNTKRHFYSNEYYKNRSIKSELITVLNHVDNDEIYEIVIITAYYYSVIKDQYGQSYLIHTNNLKLID
jgi:predicted membrane protein